MIDDNEHIVTASKDIVCKNCVWAFALGPRNLTCPNYSVKPNDVYFEGKECPKFEAYNRRDN